MKDKLLPKLSQDLLEILNDEEYYDVTIEVGKDPDVEVFRAHMNILHYRSPYLKRILSTTNKKKNNGALVHIKLPNILPNIFKIILRYIYEGKLDLEEYDTLDIIKVLVAANELHLQELTPHLESFLIKNKADWIEQNFNLVYQTSFESDSFLELQKYCTDLVSREPHKIFESLDFSFISEKLLISIIQNDNLQISEVQVWENVIKWGLAQNPELCSDLTNYTKDNFKALRNTLQQCIPFIRFYNLTTQEFLDKVLPYEKILPKDLYKDLLKTFLSLNPDAKPNDKSKPRINEKTKLEITIDSKIITTQHSELISKWINRLNDEKGSYEFKLLFRSSHDEFTFKKFHESCDNKSRTVIILKVRGSNEILGGYNPVEWKPFRIDTYGTTKDSFIFSFKNNNFSVGNYILSRVKDENRAINYSYYGPSFGCGDLYLEYYPRIGLQFRCKKNSYEKLIRETDHPSFIEDFEVFQIV